MTLLSVLAYFVRIVILGMAVGTAFIRLNLFKKLTDGQTMLIGVAATPVFVSLIDFLLGLVFIGWSSLFYFFVPIALSLVFLVVKKHYIITAAACRRILFFISSYVKGIGAWVFFDCLVTVSTVLYFSLLYNGISPKAYAVGLYRSLNTVGHLTVGLFGLTVLLVVALLVYKMIKDSSIERNFYLIGLLVIAGTITIHGFSMIDRPIVDSDRSHYELNARYFVKDKNSWEVDHYSDEKYGSSLTDDHGPLWTIYLADAGIVTDTLKIGQPIRCKNFAILWVFLCFNLILFLLASYGGETYRAGVMALILYHIYIYSFLPVLGGRDAFRFVGLLLLVIYVINQIDGISGGKTKRYEYLMLSLFCYLSMNGHEGNVYIMLGLFIIVVGLLLSEHTPVRHLFACGIAVLTGTLLGIVKTIQIYLTTGRLASSTILPFHNTPVVEQIAAINNGRANSATIWATYTIPVRLMIVLGLIGLLIMFVMSWKKRDKKGLYFSLIVFGMLLPMTGIMDWLGYEVSRWFAEQLRYRMYFLMLFSITGAWLLTRKVQAKLVRFIVLAICLLTVSFFLEAEETKCTAYYTKNHVARCNTIKMNYEKIADLVVTLTDKNAFTGNQVLLYYMHGTPKLLFHMYSEPLIQAKTDKEIEVALEQLNVGAIVLPADGLDYHNYSLLPFWNYINDTTHFSKITPIKVSYMPKYIIFYRNK